MGGAITVYSTGFGGDRRHDPTVKAWTGNIVSALDVTVI